MVSRAEEDSRDPCGFEPIEEGLVVRHDDGAVRYREVEERVIRGTVCLKRAIILRKPCGRPSVTVSVRKKRQLRKDRARDRDINVPEDPMQFRIEVDLELERHQERVRVKEDEARHRFRPSMSSY